MLRLVIRPCVVPIVVVLCVLAGVLPVSAQGVSVTSAEPATGEQDTLSLDVRVKGKNFAPGAAAEFLLNDDTNGGITVNGTTFVSSTEVVANIRIAAGATLTLFDIRVQNSNGRTGRGSDLFQVVEKGARAACTTEPLDASRFELVSTFNYLTGGGTPAYGPFLGVSAALAPVTLTLPDSTVRTVLVAAVGTPRHSGRMEFFLLDPANNGALLDGQRLCATCDQQAHVSVPIPSAVAGEPAGSRYISKGDVNADGIPDFAVADQVTGSVAVFVGQLTTGSQLTTGGQLTYTSVLLPRPAGAVNYGYDVAVGDLDGMPGDEIAIGKPYGGTKRNPSPGAVLLYRITGLTASLYQTLVPTVSPTLTTNDWYATDVAIGDVTGDGRSDLIVAAPYRDVAGVSDAGAVFVHAGAGMAAPYSLSTTPLILSAAVRVASDYFGFRVAVGNADSTGVADVVATTANNGAVHGGLVHGPVWNGQQADSAFSFLPRPGLDAGWYNNAPEIADVNGDGLVDLVLGLPGVSTGSSGCVPQGMGYLYLGQTGGEWTRLTFQGPFDGTGSSTFGYGIGAADGYPFIVVGNNQFNLGSESDPGGQVFVYRVKP